MSPLKWIAPINPTIEIIIAYRCEFFYHLSENWVILNGNRIQIKQKKFEKVIDNLDTVISNIKCN